MERLTLVAAISVRDVIVIGAGLRVGDAKGDPLNVLRVRRPYYGDAMPRVYRGSGAIGPPRGWPSLTAFLEEHPAQRVVLSFEQIESLMKQDLPPSARRYPSIWSNSAKNPYSRHWSKAGFRTTTRNVPVGHVGFLRAATPAVPPPKRPGRFGEAARTSAVGAERQLPDLILLGCVKRKGMVASAAKDLYSSPLWSKRRRYAEASGAPWLILSAAYGLVEPEMVLDPYDQSLSSLRLSARHVWAESVATDLGRRVRLGGSTIEVHAGMAYQRELVPLLEARGATVRYPLLGLTQGEQLRWYSETERSRRTAVSQPATAYLNLRPTLEVGPVADGMIRILQDPSRRFTAADLRCIDPAPFRGPGLYSWWSDSQGAATLGDAVGINVPPLIYVGQAGATRWPSGEPSSGTLWNRITRQHFTGAITMSTFRLTLAALLAEALDLSVTGRELDRTSIGRLDAFMEDHLSVVMVPFDDADLLDGVEARVIEMLDPPFNLSHVDRAVVHRRRVTAMRREILGRLGQRKGRRGRNVIVGESG